MCGLWNELVSFMVRLDALVMLSKAGVEWMFDREANVLAYS